MKFAAAVKSEENIISSYKGRSTLSFVLVSSFLVLIEWKRSVFEVFDPVVRFVDISDSSFLLRD